MSILKRVKTAFSTELDRRFPNKWDQIAQRGESVRSEYEQAIAGDIDADAKNDTQLAVIKPVQQDHVVEPIGHAVDVVVFERTIPPNTTLTETEKLQLAGVMRPGEAEDWLLSESFAGSPSLNRQLELAKKYGVGNVYRTTGDDAHRHDTDSKESGRGGGGRHH